MYLNLFLYVWCFVLQAVPTEATEGVRAPGIEVKVEVSCWWVLRIESGLLEEQSLFSNPEPTLQSLSSDIFKAVCDCFFHSASKEHTLGALDLRTSRSARRCL